MLPQQSRKIQSGAPVEGAQRDVLARLGCALAQWAPAPEQNAVSHGLMAHGPKRGV